MQHLKSSIHISQQPSFIVIAEINLLYLIQIILKFLIPEHMKSMSYFTALLLPAELLFNNLELLIGTLVVQLGYIRKYSSDLLIPINKYLLLNLFSDTFHQQ